MGEWWLGGRELPGPSLPCSDSYEDHSNHANHNERRYVHRTPEHPESGPNSHRYPNDEHDIAS